jgi:hypothetical protein
MISGSSFGSKYIQGFPQRSRGSLYRYVHRSAKRLEARPR